ncbi:MAG: 2-amino-4-hydroxy-6-hydroxymethyldihydropteridine diphosphokinase [Deltaproteobacteria bacterium]|jgi:2-amino-4-hydroxy-6-hydroxymethyldihydropteridine diphosphokinase|nr:2-amino-4-hydroxy-6-hydroxymethyldihydropteridine diphosphokinase [Deltaproteobacteria bacterium]
MVTAYIGLGANLGNCRENLLQAWSRLGKVNGIELLALSSAYRSAPVGMESENWFINAVGSLKTTLEPAMLLREMFVVEKSLGRKRILDGIPEDRSIDLDLLYWGNIVCDEPMVKLPHPEIPNRLFVLQPLVEIAPGLKHPVLQKTSEEMLQDFLTQQQETGLDQQVQKTSWSETNDEAP